jgi:hypothetical protein
MTLAERAPAPGQKPPMATVSLGQGSLGDCSSLQLAELAAHRLRLVDLCMTSDTDFINTSLKRTRSLIGLCDQR